MTKSPLPHTRASPVQPSAASPHSQERSFLRLSWDFLAVFLLAGLLALLMYLGAGTLPWLLSPSRLIIGLVFVLFAPGYTLQAALFPHPAEQERVARLAISIGSSVAILPPLVLILNALPWGVHPWPVFLSLTILMMAFSGIAIFRRLHLPGQVGSAPVLNLHVKSWWTAQNIGNRSLLALVGIGFGIALLSALAILLLPQPGDRFTEFYMLGQSGLAQDYPYEATAGQPVSVTFGISNQEGVAAVYHIKLKLGDQVLSQFGPVALENGKTWEQALEFTLPTAGDNQQIQFVLERDDQPDPYRTLQFWVNVKPAVVP